MRITLLLLVLLSNIGFAQSTADLKFDTPYFYAVDKWVAFPKAETDSTYAYGFIYLDNREGFILNYKTRFQFKGDNLVNIPKDSTAGKKYRLGPDKILVSILTQGQTASLNLPAQPEWLAAYKEGANKVAYLKNQGYHYNHVGASDLALTPLLKAYEMDAHFKGLEFELSYAYNALGQFKKAIPVLEKAIANNPNNFYFYRELGFSYKNLNRIKEAEETYKTGIKLSDNDFEKSEMAVNMAQSYFELRNKPKFKEWAKLTRKYAEKGSRYALFIDIFEEEWDK